MKRVSPSIALLTGLLVFIGCGGGGGVGGVEEETLYRIPYTGISNDALVTSANAERLVWGAYFGPAISSDIVSPFHAEPGKSFSTRQSHAIPAFLRDVVRNGLARSIARQTPESPYPGASVTDQWTEIGTCGGSASYSVTVNDVTGDFAGSVAFTDYNDCESVMSGATDVSGNMQTSTGGILLLKLHIGIITVVSGEESISMSGTVEFDWRVYPSTSTLHLRIRNDATHEVSWYENYVTAVGMSGSYTETTFSGIYYDSAYGRVTLTTDNVFRSYAWMLHPMEGSLRAAGGQGTASWLVAVSEVLYRIEADTDGNGTIDFVSSERHWPDQNSNPAVSATGDTRGNVGCTVSLDGTGSYDPDGDPLTFRWRILSAPAGSTAALVNASGLKPTFLPDLQGDYLLELSVSDGYVEVVSTHGPVSVGGGLFCSENGSGFVATGSSATAVAVGDVNGDGRNDALFVTGYYNSTDNDGKLFVMLQDASGGLSSPVRYGLPGSNTNRPSSVAIGDLNGDGRYDVVVALNGIGIEVFLQDSGGGLQPARLIETLDSSLVQIADLNNDGRMDLAGIGWGTNTITVWIQDAAGNLGAPVSYSVNHGGWDDLALGDVSGDGRTDVIVMSGQLLYDDFGVLLQTADGKLNGPAYYNSGSDYNPSALATGDVNGDGRMDAVLGHPPGISIFHQSASGSLNPPMFYPLFYGGSGDVAVGDFNSDGRKDVIGGYGGVGIGIFFQRMDGTLSPYDLYRTPIYPVGALAVGDINGDGLDDVVAGAGEGIVVFRNTGRYSAVVLRGGNSAPSIDPERIQATQPDRVRAWLWRSSWNDATSPAGSSR